ncbi:uncharacterized protein [Diadema antillarum]|uniref:uncharacterized protein n=1 Tax=Diadema antillarum TaxID=105358 RepID=UPI003A841D8A
MRPSSQRKEKLRSSFLSKLSTIRTIAERDGLRDEDIDCCVLTALESEDTPMERNIIGRIACGYLKVAVSVVVMFFLASLLISSHKPLKQYVIELVTGYSYHILRTVRIVSLPLTRQVDLSGIYYSDCLVPNPWFEGATPPDCIPCQLVRHIPEVAVIDHVTLMSPFVYQDENVNRFTFEEMNSWYLKNKEFLSSSTMKDYAQSSNTFIESPSDLFTEKRREEDFRHHPFSFEWRTGVPGRIRLVRNLCGKPSFIPHKAEIQPEMFLMVDSASSHAHSLPIPSLHGSTWLSQSHGSREIVLTPIPSCKEDCTEMSIILTAGKVLFYSSEYWSLVSVPLGDEISISCLGTFYE